MDDKTEKIRRFPRIKPEFPVLLKEINPEGTDTFARTKSLGIGGCAVLSDESMGQGSMVKVIVNAHGDTFQAVGRVVYELRGDTMEYEIGIEFLSLTPGDTKVIAGLIEAKA